MGRFRRFVIGISEVLAIILIVAVTFVSALAGYKFIHFLTGQPDQALIGLLVGSCIGFIVSALPAAAMFTLAEIADNSRKTVLLLEENLVATPPATQQQPQQVLPPGPAMQQQPFHRTFRVRPTEPANRP
jgi:hypothetical protein